MSARRGIGPVRSGDGGRCPAWRFTAAAVLLALAVLRALVSDASADTSRFVPWKGETPGFSLKDAHGKVHYLADYRGKVVLVNFWATWCEPCKDEMPSIVKLRERLAGQPFEVLVINFGESSSRVGEFLAREKLALTALLDPNKDAAKAWRVRVLPGSFLVGRDGRARYTVIGEIDWATEAAVRKVEELLSGVAYDASGRDLNALSKRARSSGGMSTDAGSRLVACTVPR